METLHIPFTKFHFATVDYDLEGVADWITGKSKSIYHEYSRNPTSPEFCGFYLPPFQRPECWDEERKIRLIESLFCGIDIGVFLVVNNFDAPNVDGWLIDGQQRLSAIRDFVLGKFSVFGGKLNYNNLKEVSLEFDGKGFVNEARLASRVWKGLYIHVGRIQDVTDERILREIYNRHNFGGIAHKESERA